MRWASFSDPAWMFTRVWLNGEERRDAVSAFSLLGFGWVRVRAGARHRRIRTRLLFGRVRILREG